MSESQENLFTDFKKSSKSDWAEKATKDLKGEDVFDKYNRNLDETITLQPYYDQSDLESLENITAFQNRLILKDNPTGENRYWENTQRIVVDHISKSNEQALEALNNGADGLIFDLSTSSDNIQFDALLKDIQLDYCSVSLILGENYASMLNSYKAYISTHQLDQKKVNGIIFFENSAISPKVYYDIFQSTIDLPGLKISVSSEAENLTNQIADLLSNMADIIDFGQKETIISKLISKAAVTLPVSVKYFEEMAKIRALRNLFYQMAQAYEVSDFNPEDLHVHCVSPAWTEEKYQPHANMLKSTTAAMSAILGGCDSLEVAPEDYQNTLMVRVARNVSSILKEESYLNSTADPVAGSYYLEILTDKLAQEAWKKFQNS